MKKIVLVIAALTLVSCQHINQKNDRMGVAGHINDPVPVDIDMDIPPVVQQIPIIAAPEPVEKLQTFTIVATGVSANELLFALARDARLNLDIDPSITGLVSINAIDQTLPQILKRIARQVSLRYYLDGPNLIIEKDSPFIRTYRIDYLNMSRVMTSSVNVTTQIASGETGGGGNSSTGVTNNASNDFWTTLEANIGLLAGTGTVISNRESGTISVRTTAAVHEDIQSFIDQVINSARKQVLIEATVVEVTLNDNFQSGVDWSSMSSGTGWSFQQNALAGALGTAPFTAASYTDNSNPNRTITAAIKALDSFGEVSVMSSPKIMAINNQTSILKVVDNRVYFTTEIQEREATDNSAARTTFTTTINTVPVGFVMNVTPYITTDDEVILNIRPTISRILRFVNTPNPALNTAGINNPIPEIQIREMESVLRVADGSTAIIGGLMQDSATTTSSGIPGIKDNKEVGFFFGSKTESLSKTELVIFLRPRIITNASVDTSLRDFKRFMNPRAFSDEAQ